MNSDGRRPGGGTAMYGNEGGGQGAGGIDYLTGEAAPSSSSSEAGGLLTSVDINDVDFSENIFSQLQGLQEYMPLDDFATGVSWGATGDILPLLTSEGFGSAAGPMSQSGKEGSSSNDMDHEVSDVSSLNDEGEDSGHEDGHGGGMAMGGVDDMEHGHVDRPARKKSKSEADKTKARNREHARNTRLRKKAYIETLRQTLQSLTDEREKSERSMKVSMARVVEQQCLRKQVIQNFFIHRARGELDRRRWASILDENCFMRMPVTPYRYFPASEVVDNCRHVHGIEGIIRDTASLHVLAQSLGRSPNEKVQIAFFAEADHVIISGSSLMCRWLMKTENAVRCGGAVELHFYGMLHATFGQDRKIAKLQFVFDVMGFMQQLRRCSGRARFQVAPSTLQLAEEPSEEARLILAINSPYLIQSINQAWLNTFGVGPQDCQGKGLVVEPPPPIDGFTHSMNDEEASRAVAVFYGCLSRQLPCNLTVVYYPRPGQGGVYARLRLFPLLSGGQMAHYMAALEPLIQDGPLSPGPLPVLVLR